MGVDAMDWVFRKSPYCGELMLIQLAISDGVHEPYNNCFPVNEEVVEKLAAKAHCSIAAVRSAIMQMTEDGLLEIVRDQKVAEGEVMYRFLMPELVEGQPIHQKRRLQ